MSNNESQPEPFNTPWDAHHKYTVGSTWPGFSKIRYLFIFGDSYSSTHMGVANHIPGPEPTDLEPLGVPWPGMTYTEDGGDNPNWVGFLVRADPGHLVYNYAKGGARVTPGVKYQIQAFLSQAASIPWTAQNALFVTWVGINDLAFANDPEPLLDTMFELQEKLYAVGARNFLFPDLPPVNRSPAYKRSSVASTTTKFTDWNASLHRHIQAFISAHNVHVEAEQVKQEVMASSGTVSVSSETTVSTVEERVSIISFSTFKVFSDLLDNPEAHGVASSEAGTAGGPIWADHLHPTSKTHGILAHSIVPFLLSIPAATTT